MFSSEFNLTYRLKILSRTPHITKLPSFTLFFSLQGFTTNKALPTLLKTRFLFSIPSCLAWSVKFTQQPRGSQIKLRLQSVRCQGVKAAQLTQLQVITLPELKKGQSKYPKVEKKKTALLQVELGVQIRKIDGEQHKQLNCLLPCCFTVYNPARERFVFPLGLAGYHLTSFIVNIASPILKCVSLFFHTRVECKMYTTAQEKTNE